MRSIGDVRDCFVKVNGNWFERHNIAYQLGLDVTNAGEALGEVGEGFVGCFIKVQKLLTGITNIPIGKILINKFKEEQLGNSKQLDCFMVSKYNAIIFVMSKTELSNLGYIENVIGLKNYIIQDTSLYAIYELAEPLDLPCTPEQIQQLENIPSTYKDFTIIQSQDETPAYLEVSGIYDLNNLINN